MIRSDASLAGYKLPELARLYRDLGERLARLPGVTSTSIARSTPESGYSSSGNFSIEDYTAPANFKMDGYRVAVAPGFFETMEIPLLLGRTISARDTPDSSTVAVVNQAFCRYLSAASKSDRPAHVAWISF